MSLNLHQCHFLGHYNFTLMAALKIMTNISCKIYRHIYHHQELCRVRLLWIALIRHIYNTSKYKFFTWELQCLNRITTITILLFSVFLNHFNKSCTLSSHHLYSSQITNFPVAVTEDKELKRMKKGQPQCHLVHCQLLKDSAPWSNWVKESVTILVVQQMNSIVN
jgi:hypothetical protein